MNHQQVRAEMGFNMYTAVHCSLDEFKADLDRLAESIGASAHRPAQICLEYERGWGDELGTLEAYIWRWETDEECVAREAREKIEREQSRAAYAERMAAEERRTYEALKAKFEGQQ